MCKFWVRYIKLFEEIFLILWFILWMNNLVVGIVREKDMYLFWKCCKFFIWIDFLWVRIDLCKKVYVFIFWDGIWKYWLIELIIKFKYFKEVVGYNIDL